MKRMVWSALACVMLVGASIVAYEHYQDILAGVLFCLAVIPSCLFEDARKTWKAER